VLQLVELHSGLPRIENNLLKKHFMVGFFKKELK
jgi:hypothetical protein